MAEYLATAGWITPGSAAAYLRSALSHDYFVVVEPVVCRCPLEAVVVGPSGLVVLPPEDPAQVVAGNGHGGKPPSEAECERICLSAVRRFMADEFPGLKPDIIYMRPVHAAISEAAGAPATDGLRATWQTAGMPLAEAIMTAIPPTETPLWADDATREEVAVALRDRELTVSQRTTRPFVFRTGGALRVGSKAWTIKEAVAHMDRYPEDGIYHLRNGTLAAWLSEEGAEHLAQLARDAILQSKTDWRAALETFLLGTGLVERPKLDYRPKVVDLGYALDGERVARALTLRRGPGRGYLFGEVSASDHWLHVEPVTLAGGPTEFVVSADTDALAIYPEAQMADVLVLCSASETPVAIPVKIRVTAMPSAALRWIVRPAAALALAGLIGAGVGLLFDFSGVALPQALASAQPLGLSAWVPIIAALWALFGLIRGLAQPPAWPARYAAGRWLSHTAMWSGLMALVAIVLVWAWRLGLGSALFEQGGAYAHAALIGLALAVIPASVAEAIFAGVAGDPTLVKGRRNTRRVVALAVAVALVMAALVGIPRAAAPAWRDLQSRGALESAANWAQNGWTEIEGIANRAMNVLYLQYYDKRAPLAPTPIPTSPAQTVTPVATDVAQP